MLEEDLSVLSRPAPPPDQVVNYGTEPDQVVDVRRGASQRGWLIMIHGGFWKPEYDRVHAGPLCSALATLGWTVANIEYRRVPRQPHVTLDDVALAIERLPALLDQRTKPIVIGHSAGGHLALWAASQCAALLAGALALAPVADLRLAHRLQLGVDAVPTFLGGTPEEHADIDPTQRAAPAVPVTLVHGDQDALVPLDIAASYQARHTATRLVVVPNTAHFGVIDPLSSAWPTVVAELERLAALKA